MGRMIDADVLREEVCSWGMNDYEPSDFTDAIDDAPTVEAIPVDYIWDRAEAYEKQWLEDDNHWAKNVAEALRALLEDWDGEVGGILEQYENS